MAQELVEPIVEIRWTECRSYDDARDHFSCGYIHERDGQAYYVGIVDNSVFGGSSRNGWKRSGDHMASKVELTDDQSP